MFSLISVPPRSLQPARSIWATPGSPIFTQLAWMFGISAPYAKPGDGVDEHGLAERRAAPRLALEVDRRRHVHERKADELGEPDGADRHRLLLQVAGAHDVAGPVDRLLDGTEHHRHVGVQADPVRHPVRLEPLLGVDLVGAQDRPDLVVEDLRRGAGQRRQPDVLQPAHVRLEVFAEPLGAFGHLEGGEPVDVHVGHRVLHGPGDVDVVVAVEVRVDAALQGDLGGPHVPALERPLGDVVERQQVRRAAQVERQRALREPAELALERAHVGVVDVPVRHPRQRLADQFGPHPIGGLGDGEHVGSASLEQRHDLVDARLVTGLDAGEHLGHRTSRR